MKKNGKQAKQKPKPEKHHPIGPRVHRIQEIPLMERDISPPPRPKDHTKLIAILITFLLSLFMLIIIVWINYITTPEVCSKAEFFVQKICTPKLEKLEVLTNTTVPDFSMTPIGRDIAKKCFDVEECLSTLRCTELFRYNQLPDRCRLYQFFQNGFADCRKKLRKLKDPPTCVRKFFVEAPVSCGVLYEHLDCYRQQIQDVCETSGDFWRLFEDHIDEYMEIIDCRQEMEEEEEVEAPDDDDN
uniref:DUF19 domain-containing protein n=1 Tax=Caenorhabditis tropicalis TaxID=1561998 RepID=A0A1I7V2M4_9PELO